MKKIIINNNDTGSDSKFITEDKEINQKLEKIVHPDIVSETENYTVYKLIGPDTDLTRVYCDDDKKWYQIKENYQI